MSSYLQGECLEQRLLRPPPGVGSEYLNEILCSSAQPADEEHRLVRGDVQHHLSAGGAEDLKCIHAEIGFSFSGFISEKKFALLHKEYVEYLTLHVALHLNLNTRLLQYFRFKA